MNRVGAPVIQRLAVLRKVLPFFVIFSMLLSLARPALDVQAAASLTVDPITWNVVGLDSNNVNVGPANFPVGARVCNTGDAPATDVVSSFVWDSADDFIDFRPGSLTSFSGVYAVPSLDPGDCTDFYYEISIDRDPAAYTHTRRYHITAGSAEAGPVSTSIPREIYVERLVSQNRNSVTQVKLDGVSVPDGGAMELQVGGTYDIQLVGSTSTNGYNQLESFINLPNTIFRINSVTSTYGVTSLIPPYDLLYADSCGWDSNPLSPTYRSCVESDGKTGGEVTVNYNVTILSGAGTSQEIDTLLYDFSGSSFHYNSDFSSSARVISIVTPLSFSKSFTPSTIQAAGTSTLAITLTNLSDTAVSGVEFTDALPASPAQMAVADPSNASAVGCGSPVLTAEAGATSVSLSDASIAPGATCTVSVDVTVPADGVYANATGALTINSIDTGLTASANLTAADAKTGTGLACTNRDLARWSMDPAAGTSVPPAYTFRAGDVSSAETSFYSTVGGNYIDTADGSPANSWVGYGWPKTGTPAIDTATYFQIAVDTSQYSSVSIDFDATANTNWGPNGNNMFVYSSATGGAGSYTQILPTASLSKDTWVGSHYTFTPVSTSPGTTYFRISAVGASSTGSNATLKLDNIVVSGCGLPVQPELTKDFAPALIPSGGVSTLTFTLANGNGVDLNGAAFTDPLPAGVVVAGDPAASSTCGGSFTPSAGDTVLSFTGGIIPASSSCTVSVDVTSSAKGVHHNVSGQLSTNELGTNSEATGSAEADLTVVAPPGFTKAFLPNPIYAGETSTLTFTLSNPNQEPLLGAAFTDDLPAGMQVSSAPAASTTCSDATFAPGAGAATLAFTGGTIPAQGSCTAQVDVTAASVGDYANTSSTLTTSIAGLESGTASDTLAVIAHYPGLKLSKQVASALTGPWTSFITTPPGSDVYYRLTVENVGDVDLTSVVVSDPTVDLASCALSTSFTLTTADPIASCTVGPLTAKAGSALNTATAQGRYGGATYASTSTAEYLGVNMASAPGLTLIKQVGLSPSGPWESALTGVTTGAPLYYKFTVINSGNADLYGLSIVDLGLDASGCEWTEPLPSKAANVCVVRLDAALPGTNANTAHAESTSPEVVSPSDSATYTSGGYSISGSVWEDRDADGSVDAGEPGLFNVILDLYLDTGDGTLDTSADTYLGTQYSASDGAYAFSHLPEGTYFVDVSGGVAGYLHVSGEAAPFKIVLSGDTPGVDFGYRQPSIDLGVTNTDGVDAVDAGNSTTYTLRVTNEGDVSVAGAVLTGPLGAGLHAASAACSADAGNRCGAELLLSALVSTGQVLPALAPGEFYEVELTANVTAASGSVTSTAAVAPPDGSSDVNPANDSQADTDTVNPSALPSTDLAVTITNGSTSLDVASASTYTIRVTNNGPTSITGATLSTLFSAGLTAESVVCSGAEGNRCSESPDLSALNGSGVSLPLLDAGQFYEIEVIAGVDALSGSVTAGAKVETPLGTTDSDTNNNTQADSDPIVPFADLTLTKTDETATVDSGGSTTYTVRVTSLGPSPVTGAILKDTPGAGLTLTGVDCTAAEGNLCQEAPDLASLTGAGLTLPELPAGGFYEISVTAHVTAGSGSVTNSASIAVPDGATDPDTGNNTASDSDTVTPAPLLSADLSITKTDGTPSVTAGSAAIYTIRVVNNGPSQANGVVLTETPGSGLTLTGASCTSAPGNRCAGSVDLSALVDGGLTLPNLQAGQVYEITVDAEVTASQGSVSNAATLTLPEGLTDPNPGNDTMNDTDEVVGGDPDPVTYRLFFPAIVRNGLQVAQHWQIGLGYEDLPQTTGKNDYDYNDWNVLLDGSVTYTASSNLIERLDVTFTPRARGASYDHRFKVIVPAGVLPGDGTAVLTLYDAQHTPVSVQTIAFDGSAGATFVIFPKTSDALPGSAVNTVEGKPAVLPQRTAELSITFDSPIPYDLDLSHLDLPHGEGLFFDPVLDVLNTADHVGQGDVRLLSIPVQNWLWPEESIRIDRAYPLVTYAAGNPPSLTFPGQWWAQHTTCVYDGVKCAVP